MFHIINRYQKRIMIGVAILIIPMFIWWGGSPGGGGSSALRDTAILIDMGDSFVETDTFSRALNNERRRRSQSGMEVTNEDLLQQGVAQDILEQLVSRELLRMKVSAENMTFEQDYLVEQFKKDPAFQRPDGSFNAEQWNAFVTNPQVNWNDIYASVAQSIAWDLVIQKIQASARVPEADVREEFDNAYTQVEVKYVKASPKILVTDEELQAEYEANASRYEEPAKRRAEFVRWDLMPLPALATEVAEKAKAGEDFAELAKAHSDDIFKDKGGDREWLRQELGSPQHERVVHEMEVGEVRGPLPGPLGYYIFKVDEEREQDGVREVRVRQIRIDADLSPDEAAALEAKAAEFAEQASEAESFTAAAESAGLDVLNTDMFNLDSMSIENIPGEDLGIVRPSLDKLEAGALSDPITASRYIYVARIAEVGEPTLPPLEDVRDRVEQAVIMTQKQSPEYAALVEEFAEKVPAEVKTLADLPGLFPELEQEEGTAGPFSAREYDFQKLPLWNPREVIDLVKDAEPGVLVGPARGFMGDLYFLELVKLTPPTDEQWAEQGPLMHDAAVSRLEMARVQDYLLYLREQPVWSINQAAFSRVLGLDQPGDDAAEDEGEAEATSDTEASTEEAPAEEAPVEEPAE